MKNKLKKYNNGGKVGEWFMNQGRSLIDTPLSIIGMNNIIPDEAYKGAGSKFFKGYSNIMGGVGKAALPLAANILAPGIGGMAAGAIQNVGSQFNPQQEEQMSYAEGGIHIDPSKKGTFTAAATKHGKSVQAFASQVLANKENYSPAMVKKANFAKNASKWHHADGGIHQGFPTAELEREEVMRMPNGETAQVDGASHENGGVQVNIPNGTQIFSDRLKDPMSKITFAKLAEKYKINKEQKVLDDDKANPLAKSTAKLAMELKQRKLSEIFNVQETLKQAKLDKYASKLGLNTSNKFPNGGTKLPQYFDGGYSDRTGTYDSFGYKIGEEDGMPKTEDQMRNAMNFLDSWRVNGGAGTPAYEDYYSKLMTAGKMKSANDIQIPSSTPTISSTPPGVKDQSINLTPKKGTNIDWNKKDSFVLPSKNVTNNTNQLDQPYKPTGIDYAMMASNLIGPAYTLATNKKPKPFSYVTPDYQKYDPTAELNEADRQNRIAQGLAKNFAAGNSAAYLATMPMLQANMMTNKQNVLNRAQNINTQYYNQLQPTIADIKNKNIDAMQQDMARYRDINRAAVTNLGENVSGTLRGVKQGQQDVSSANLISSMFPDYNYDVKSNKWVHKQTGKILGA